MKPELLKKKRNGNKFTEFVYAKKRRSCSIGLGKNVEIWHSRMLILVLKSPALLDAHQELCV